MNSKLQDLTQKIFNEGIEKAKSEADQLIIQANNEADLIINRAKSERENLLAKAQKEHEQLKHQIISELKLASNQILTTVKFNIIHQLSKLTFNQPVKTMVQDQIFMKELILAVIGRWQEEENGKLNLEVILSEKLKADLLINAKTEVKDLIAKGVDFKFDKKISEGFKIGPKDHSYQIAFTSAEFNIFFETISRELAKEILFPGDPRS